MKLNRRTIIATIAVSILSWTANTAWAAQSVVEIIAFSHPPVQSALKPMREWLANQGAKLKVKELDMDSAEGEKRMQVIGLKGHIPIVILIDGKYKHTRKDGSAVEFVSFPSGSNASGSAKGGWSVDDVQAMLKSQIQ